VEEVIYLSGYNLLTGQVTSYNGTAFIRFKPFEERKAAAHSVTSIKPHAGGAAQRRDQGCQRAGAQPAAIRGLSTSGGFTFVLAEPHRLGYGELSKVLQDVLGQARKRKEIGFVYSGFDPRVRRSSTWSTATRSSRSASRCPSVLHAADVSGQLLRQRLQPVRPHLPGDGASRWRAAQPARRREPLLRARRERHHVPLSTIVSSRPINGPQYFERFNVYSAATINGTNAPATARAGDRRDGGDRARAAAGLRLRMERGDLPGEKDRRQTGFIFAISLVFVLLCSPRCDEAGRCRSRSCW